MYVTVQERTIFVATRFFIGPFWTNVTWTKEGRKEGIEIIIRVKVWPELGGDIVSRLYSVKDMDTD